VTTPVYRPNKANCTLESSASAALFSRVQPQTDTESIEDGSAGEGPSPVDKSVASEGARQGRFSGQRPSLVRVVPSSSERWLLCLVSFAAVAGVVAYGSGESAFGFFGQLLSWALLTGLGVYRLLQQKPQEWLYVCPQNFSFLGGGTCQIEGRWSLFPWLILIRYRVPGRRWTSRLLWPDSADPESLRVLRASLFS